MAEKKSRSSNSNSSKSTGRPSNSEPKVQTFSKFQGCNFELAARQFESWEGEDDQTDLEMNFLVLQNNAKVESNQTIQTRQNLVTLFTAPEGTRHTDIATLINDELYIACEDKNIYYGTLGGELNNTVVINDIDGETRDNTWTFLGYAEDQLVGMTAGKQLWTGAYGTHTIENARTIPTPPALTFSQLTARGSLTISSTLTDECPFRITLRYTHLNKFGPTLASDPLTFYASKPTTEWSGAAFVSISGTAPTGYNIVAVELYYTEDEYQDPAFLGRVDMRQQSDGSRDGGSWTYNWVGYLFDTSMWTLANLSLPTENYTSGVPASKMAQHDGRLYFWGGEPDYRLWIGGNPGNTFSVSTGVGGGFADIEPGSGQAIRVVPKYKTYNGASIVTMLCDNPNSSKEQRHNLVENNITLSNEQSTKGWQSEKVNGTVGCKSYYGAGVWADGLYAVSRYGLALTTLTMEYNSQLRVNYVSDAIKPVFTQQDGTQLDAAVLLCVDDILYMTFGAGSGNEGNLDNIVFCYDINLKAWWSYSLDVDEPILNMINIDHEANREGIGIITPGHVFLLPTTKDDSPDTLPTFDVLLETAELSTTKPSQGMQHLSQLEFRFDYFIGDLTIEVHMIDRFGRPIIGEKYIISSDEVIYNCIEYIRVDKKCEYYKLVIKGKANFRLTHFMAKTYPIPARMGMSWGFDSRQSMNGSGDIRGYFKSYNDIRRAIIP